MLTTRLSHAVAALASIAAALLLVVEPADAQAVGREVIYQGKLDENGAAATGDYEFRFSLWNNATVGQGSQIGPVIAENLLVEDGLFDVELDFGADAFNGFQRFLQIEVRAAGETDYTLLGRQKISAAPYAVQTRGIFVNDAGDRWGFGTINPKRGLHNTGDYYGPGHLWLHAYSGDGTSGTAYLQARDDSGTSNIGLQFRTQSNGSVRNPLYLAPGGWIGIGNSSPDDMLHVSGTVRARALRLVGGADIAEPFNIGGVSADDTVLPGMVVAIDPDNPGSLRIADAAYDATVAGIVSGANGIETGMTLAQEGTIADGEHPVALSGRVWCWVDADINGAIRPGDLLTTSIIPGHAMRADDREKAFGATIGKAMTPLESGRGMVLVLVNLH